MNDYHAFLERKRIVSKPVGFDMPRDRLNPQLFNFQKDIVRWALRKGRAAIFADCGLGKTPMQLEWARNVIAETQGACLVVAPLAVNIQTKAEGEKFGVPVTLCKQPDDVRDGVNVTNYERLDRFDPSFFSSVVLDESSILKNQDGVTRTELIEMFSKTHYRLACTATPAPNDFMELGNHVEFLGIMGYSEMLAMFFVHDGGETQKWRLKGHAEDAFWRWVCSWAVMLRRPSDLGYENAGFDLPPLRCHENIVHADHSEAQGAGLLFIMEAHTMDERRIARRGSTDARALTAAQIISREPDEPWIVWCDLNAEADAVRRLVPDAIEIRGSDDIEEKEDRLMGFSERRYRILVTKPSIAGHGLNWQHCARVIFLGLSDSYEQFYQAVRRCWRFGQTREVHAHIVISELEGAVLANIQRKEADAERMAEGMIEHMAEITKEEIAASTHESAKYETDDAAGVGWRLMLGDCIERIQEIDDASIHYSIFSPPFASLYTYSNSERDMGNTKTHGEFIQHFRFLIGELLRVLMPGRLLSFHCMNLPTSKVRHGVIGIEDFRGELIRMFVEAGWIYHSEVVIWKDPVTAMQRTKALGLLHKQLKKDSCMSRQGIPDYLVTMRKPGENPERVEHTNESFPVSLWQRYASPVWFDINPSKTIQGYRDAREERDEKHICPLQLEVIERALILWTNPGDVVLSPFAGVGSEGYQALLMGREFIGIELKRAYWEQAVKNMGRAEMERSRAVTPLFAEDSASNPD